MTAATETGPATVRATRYVSPFREGGSLPGLVEADGDGLYVVKFRGAGQGPKALVAEGVAGGGGGALGRRGGARARRVRHFVLVEPDAEPARAEPDPEIHELIERSVGVNLGVDYLPGAIT